MSLSDRDDGIGQTKPLNEKELAEIRAAERAKASDEARISLVIYHRDGVRVVPLVSGQSVVVGRSHPADVPIRDSTLSRQHACVELVDGEVWVEDLQSTNGTWLNGQRIDRAKVAVGDELTFGAAMAALQPIGPVEGRAYGLESHDRFQLDLDAEVERARAFNRSLTLLIVRAARRRTSPLSQWFPQLRKQLRPFDRLALYTPSTLEVLAPEIDEARAAELAQAIVRLSPGLLCGFGALGPNVRSADELLGGALAALQRATVEEPVQALSAEPRPETTEALEVEAGGLVVQSEAMRRVLATASRVASSMIPVLIQGETGSGKDVVARSIHDGGKRKGRPMVVVNCGGIPPQLVEATLFGHEKGAFTGAMQTAKGVFEAADGGTVFLDEVGELPADAQAALLRVLETKKVTRVGSTKEIEVDVRVIAATHRDLEAMCEQGSFRRDLLYRLEAMAIRVPPLRERPEEIGALSAGFVARANEANGCRVEGVSEDALALLKRYTWPGNVRELRNAIERAVVLAETGLISIEDLPERVRDQSVPGVPPHEETAAATCGGRAEGEERSLREEVARFEAELLVKALDRFDWDRAKAAHSLGLPLRTLSHKMQVHGIRRMERP